jgi:EmrB/QacA subfamily drug resistance transporter
VVLGAVMVGTFLAPLDSSIVNIALPSIARDLGVSLTMVGWVATAYLLTTGSLVLTMGRAADIWGLRRIYTLGFVVFGIGSLGSALSGAFTPLIAARVVQALGAAMMFASGPAIITVTFPRERRGWALGVVGLSVSAGLSLGPVLGGLLVGFFGWPSIFLVNVPLVAVAAIVAWRVIPDDCPSAEPFDLLGAVLGATALGGLLYGFSGLDVAPLVSARVLLPIAASVAAGWLFVATERRLEHPMLDLTLFDHWQFSAGALSALLAFVALSASIFLMPFYLTEQRALDIRLAGLALAATPLLMALLGPFFGRMSDRIGSRVLTTGGMCLVAGALLGLSFATATTPLPLVIAGLAGVGAGLSMFQAPNTSAVLSLTPRDRLGVGSAIIGNARSVGMAVGISLTAAVAGSAMSDGNAGGAEFAAAMALAFRAAALVAVVGAAVAWSRGKVVANRLAGRGV